LEKEGNEENLDACMVMVVGVVVAGLREDKERGGREEEGCIHYEH